MNERWPRGRTGFILGELHDKPRRGERFRSNRSTIWHLRCLYKENSWVLSWWTDQWVLPSIDIVARSQLTPSPTLENALLKTLFSLIATRMRSWTKDSMTRARDKELTSQIRRKRKSRRKPNLSQTWRKASEMLLSGSRKICWPSHTSMLCLKWIEGTNNTRRTWIKSRYSTIQSERRLEAQSFTTLKENKTQSSCLQKRFKRWM